MKKQRERNPSILEKVLLVGILILIVSIFISFIIFKLNQKKSNLCYHMQSLNETLNDIKNKCGSTFITKKYGNEGEWFVFNSEGCIGKGSSCFYTHLEDCLK